MSIEQREVYLSWWKEKEYQVPVKLGQKAIGTKFQGCYFIKLQGIWIKMDMISLQNKT